VNHPATGFVPLPAAELLRIAWPTPNHNLIAAPDRFFARTRANPDYGKPGWTRDCGKRFHRGCDIAPVHLTPTGKTTRVTFTDCATGGSYRRRQRERMVGTTNGRSICTTATWFRCRTGGSTRGTRRGTWRFT
jgi:hypothetical protein